jgi:hypothetical protein
MRRSSLGPSDAKMDAALIRNLQRLAEARAAEIARLTAENAEAGRRLAEKEMALSDAAKLRAQLTAENEALRAVVAYVRKTLAMRSFAHLPDFARLDAHAKQAEPK